MTHKHILITMIQFEVLLLILCVVCCYSVLRQNLSEDGFGTTRSDTVVSAAVMAFHTSLVSVVPQRRHSNLLEHYRSSNDENCWICRREVTAVDNKSRRLVSVAAETRGGSSIGVNDRSKKIVVAKKSKVAQRKYIKHHNRQSTGLTTRHKRIRRSSISNNAYSIDNNSARGSITSSAIQNYYNPPHSTTTTTQLHSSNSNSMNDLAEDEDNTGISKKFNDNNNDDNNNNTDNWLFKLVIPLLLVYISNQWSRSCIYYLVDFSSSATTTTDAAFTAMNIDIGFDQTQYGVLASVAFTVLFSIASVGAGIAADRYNRKVLTILATVLWSLMTFGTALSHTYTEVVLCRVGMGLACAFATPTAYTLLQQYVPKSKVATASSIYGTGVAFGSGLASFTLLLDTNIGWRSSLNCIGAFGIAAAAIAILILPNDTKPKTDELLLSSSLLDEETVVTASTFDTGDSGSSNTILYDIQQAFSTRRAQWIYVGSLLRFCSGLCIGVWGAPYFRMTYPDNIAQYSFYQAIISAVAASASGLLGGTIADKLVANSDSTDDDVAARRLWVPVVGSLLAAPAWYLTMSSSGESSSFEIAMIWLAIEYFVAECWFGPTIATLQATVGPKIGGTAQGLFTLTGAVANFAPSILGYVYSQNIIAAASTSSSSSADLANLLSLFVCIGYISSAFCFAMAATTKQQLNSNTIE